MVVKMLYCMELSMFTDEDWSHMHDYMNLSLGKKKKTLDYTLITALCCATIATTSHEQCLLTRFHPPMTLCYSPTWWVTQCHWRVESGCDHLSTSYTVPANLAFNLWMGTALVNSAITFAESSCDLLLWFPPSLPCLCKFILDKPTD